MNESEQDVNLYFCENFQYDWKLTVEGHLFHKINPLSEKAWDPLIT